MSERKHNFNAGPTALPLSVLETVQANLVDFHGQGLSLVEMSHRTPVFEEVIARAKETIGQLYNMPDTHEVMFLQGGASMQFAQVPLNQGSGGAYIDTGRWAGNALAEARRIGSAHDVWNSVESGHNSVPQQHELPAMPDGAPYLHYTSNNTIYGTQFHYVPEVSVPLVCDMSSDFISRPVDVSAFDIIYAGAQKNAGPSGVTILIIRKTVSRAFTGAQTTPKILRYATQAEKDSMFNTPNTFGIWVVGLVAEWVQANGGLQAMAEINTRKANLLYDLIDSDPRFSGHAVEHSRSEMNVTFRMENEADEKALLAAAADANIMGIRGHRSVGGLRASIYNAVAEDTVRYLRDFLHATQV